MADSPRSILARLEQLKHWQAEQQRVLLEKHIVQQQILEKEQRRMYEVLGLTQQATDDDEEQSYEDSASEPEYEETNLQQQLKSEKLKPIPAQDGTSMFDSDSELPAAQGQEVPQEVRSNVPKRRFLKRGEGLRARFKVDPDKFKLNNLPKYKFANHNRDRTNRKQGPNGGASLQSIDEKRLPTITQKTISDGTKEDDAKRTDDTRKQSKKISRPKSDTGIILDVNRVQDRKLESTKRSLGSLPSNELTEASDKAEAFVGKGVMDGNKIFSSESERSRPRMEETVSPVVQDVPWKRRLDPPIRAPSGGSKEQRDLNFFEQLEQKVVGKSFNPNSSSILRFIAENDSTACEEDLTIDHGTDFDRTDLRPLIRPEDVRQIIALAPEPSEVTIHDDDDDDDDDDGGNDDEETGDHQEHVHVRFVENENHSDQTDHESYNLNGMTLSKMSTPNDKFVYRSQSLDKKTAQESDSSESESDTETDENGEEDVPTVDTTDGQSANEETVTKVAGDDDDTLRNEILAKSELLKERLAELEREIDSYRRENADLIRAKQEHEHEKLNLQQDREEMEERMNDERIKMEVYFHDERMKIEAERKKALKEAQKPNKKDREEILRLTGELAEAKKNQKEREAKHSASLARFRAQVKTLEKDLQEVRLELESVKKDNRRLETENARLKRQNNSRMLVEINRNIAKLAAGNVEEDAQREAQKNGVVSQPKGKMGVAKMGEKNVSHPKQNVERRISHPQQTRAKVKSHPSVAVRHEGRGHSLPAVHVQEGYTESDEENNPQPTAQQRSSADEESEVSDDSEDEEDERVGANSSSATDSAEPSSYFPQKTARKTLFNAMHFDNESLPLTPGLVRREIPTKNASDVADRTPETAELIKNLKREKVNADGSREIWYPNGNLKKISPDGLMIRMLYFNKDIKETNMSEGTTKYYYFENNTWHTTYLNGLEILEFPDGQTEHRFKDGSTEVHFPNGSIRTTNPNSVDIAEEWKYPDGTTVIIRKNDDKEINLPNGQVEIHTKAHKRRIYPDGTVKFVYPDGSQESRYSNGRIRLKDKDGRLISDTGGGNMR